jgi:hypothetical protein
LRSSILRSCSASRTKCYGRTLLPLTQLIAGYRISKRVQVRLSLNVVILPNVCEVSPLPYRGVAITVSCCAVAIGGRISKAVRGRYGGVSNRSVQVVILRKLVHSCAETVSVMSMSAIIVPLDTSSLPDQIDRALMCLLAAALSRSRIRLSANSGAKADITAGREGQTLPWPFRVCECQPNVEPRGHAELAHA